MNKAINRRTQTVTQRKRKGSKEALDYQQSESLEFCTFVGVVSRKKATY